MKNFLFGLLVGVGLFCLMGMTQINTTHETPDKVTDEFTNIYKNAQGRNFRLERATPTVSDLLEHEVVIVKSNEIPPKLVFRLDNALYAVAAEAF